MTTEYSHLQFSGVIPRSIAKEAFELLKSGMDLRPANCGGWLRIMPRPYGENDPATGDKNGIVIDLQSVLTEVEKP